MNTEQSIGNKVIVRRAAARRFRVAKRDNPGVKSGYVGHEDMHAWVVQGVDIAVLETDDRDVTRGVLLDLIEFASTNGIFYATQERVIELIRLLHKPGDVGRRRAAALSKAQRASNGSVVVRRYIANRRLFLPGVGYVSLADLRELVCMGLDIAVVADKTSVENTERHEGVVGGVSMLGADVTHHTLTVAFVEVAKQSRVDLPPKDLTNLLLARPVKS